MGGGRWNPWRDLRGREWIQLSFDDIAELGGGGIYARDNEGVVIVLSPRLTPEERKVVLAHELVHDERGAPVTAPDAPAAWAPIARREEFRVHRIVAGRLVPVDELRVVVDRHLELEGFITAEQVADEFGVTPAVAAEALRLLAAMSRRSA